MRGFAVVLIALAAFFQPLESGSQAGPQVRASVATIASGFNFRAIVIVAMDVADDGIDVHQAIRERPAAASGATSSRVPAAQDEPPTRGRSSLPERPPRLA